jgi:hypothetical protein
VAASHSSRTSVHSSLVVPQQHGEIRVTQVGDLLLHELHLDLHVGRFATVNFQPWYLIEFHKSQYLRPRDVSLERSQMEIVKVTINCKVCAKPFEKEIAKHFVDVCIANGAEGFTGTCPECVEDNPFSLAALTQKTMQ